MPDDPLAWIDEQLDMLETLGLRRHLRTRQSMQGAEVEIDGTRLVNFASNDYLGLAAEARLSRAVADALPREGWGSGASPLIAGRSRLHVELEECLATWEGAEAALLFSSGYAANVGAITALAGRGDILFSDANNHASIIDGCRLSGARVQVFPHRDLDYVQRALAQAGSFRRRLIVTDALFSMDGDLAPLPDLAELAERHAAMLLVDEAHATGVFGDHGRGACEHFGVEDGVHVRVGTLSKALGSAGGFISGRKSLIDWLANRARSYVFSTAPPAACCAAALAALQMVQEEPQRRSRLRKRAEQLRGRLRAQGWSTGESESQIIPVILGEPDPTMRMAAWLLDHGLFVPGIRPPSVPEGQSLLRISLSWSHTDEMIQRLVAAMEKAKERGVRS